MPLRLLIFLAGLSVWPRCGLVEREVFLKQHVVRYVTVAAFAMVIAGVAASSVVAQSAPSEREGGHYIPAPEDLDERDAVRADPNGDDAVACEKAQDALQNHSGQEQEERLERAKAAAATSTMREAIARRALPICPPAGTPRTELEPGATVVEG